MKEYSLTKEKSALKTTNWSKKIIALTGYWEPVSFLVRDGRAYKGISEDDFPYSEEMAQQLADMGINLVIWHYYKGLGVKTEEEEMQNVARFFKHLDRLGIGKGVYINFGSFFADVFPVEVPEARDWLARDMYGMPHMYSEFYRNYYRHRPCMSNTAFAEYVGRAAVKAIREAGAELISLDNCAQMPCYCSNCRSGFPEYLIEKFPSEGGEGTLSFKERFGHEFKGRFELPRGTSRMSIDTIPNASEPGLYEWIRYRQKLYEDAHRIVTDMIRQESDSVLIEWNIAMEYGEFPGMVWGLDPETAYRCRSDFFFSEDEIVSGMQDGRLIRRISTYKYARAMRNRVFVHCVAEGEPDIRLLNYAEAAVFNRGCLGRVAWGNIEDQPVGLFKEAMSFFTANEDAYVDTMPISSAALYRCSETESSFWADSTLARHALEQVLIKNSIQYDHIINDTFDDIFMYKVFICPNTICVSDAILKKIRDFIKRGGVILCTDGSFERDEYGVKRIRKMDMVISSERDVDVGKSKADCSSDKIAAILGLDSSYLDSIICLPAIDYAVPFDWKPNVNTFPIIGKDYFAEPLNKDEVLEVILRTLPVRDLEIDAPENVVGGYFITRNSGRVIHILDYEAGRDVTSVTVRFAADQDKSQNALFKSFNTEETLDIVYRGNVGECILPAFRTHAFLRF